MRCTQRIPPPGENDLHRAARPCTREATHKLIAPDGALIPGGLCLEHGQAVVEEYAAKLGETWTLRPVDEHGRLVIDEGACAHPPARQRAWFARDDTTHTGQVLCIACCNCGAVLAGGTAL